jgi:hypothetical protein
MPSIYTDRQGDKWLRVNLLRIPYAGFAFDMKHLRRKRDKQDFRKKDSTGSIAGLDTGLTGCAGADSFISIYFKRWFAQRAWKWHLLFLPKPLLACHAPFH